jgi:hypothetical protein
VKVVNKTNVSRLVCKVVNVTSHPGEGNSTVSEIDGLSNTSFDIACYTYFLDIPVSTVVRSSKHTDDMRTLWMVAEYEVMLGGSPFTTARRVLRLRMEETASRYGVSCEYIE